MEQWVIWFVSSKYFAWTTAGVTFCSAAHTLLPPWNWRPKLVEEGLCEFPLAQKYFYKVFDNRWYRVFVYIVGFVALNARSTVWRQISVNNPDSVNANAKALNGGYKL